VQSISFFQLTRQGMRELRLPSIQPAASIRYLALWRSNTAIAALPLPNAPLPKRLKTPPTCSAGPSAGRVSHQSYRWARSPCPITDDDHY
jgi:hypothetical protein